MSDELEVKEGLRLDQLMAEADAPAKQPEVVEGQTELPLQSELPVSTEQPQQLTPEALAQSQSVGKQLYTNEEIENILRDDEGKLDFDRLSPEGKLVFKSFDRGLKPKLQERGELKRRLEEVEARMHGMQQQAQPQPQVSDSDKFFAEYLQNPDSVKSRINGAIRELKKADPFDERIDQLQELKENLNDRRIQLFEYVTAQRMQQEMEYKRNEYNAMQSVSLAKSAVPEYGPELVAELDRFAGEVLKYSKEELQAITDIRNPAMAAKNFSNIYQFYKLYKGGGAKAEEIKKAAATRVESAGAGFKDDKKPSWTDDDYFSMRNKISA